MRTNACTCVLHKYKYNYSIVPFVVHVHPHDTDIKLSKYPNQDTLSTFGKYLLHRKGTVPNSYVHTISQRVELWKGAQRFEFGNNIIWPGLTPKYGCDPRLLRCD